MILMKPRNLVYCSIAALVSICSLLQTSDPARNGFAAGFYDGWDKDEDSQIYRVEETADRVLFFRSTQGVQIHFGEGDIGKPPRNVDNEYSESQVVDLLKNEKNKGLLFVWDRIFEGDDIAPLKKFVSKLGYSRVIIASTRAMGVYLVYDSAKEERRWH